MADSYTFGTLEEVLTFDGDATVTIDGQALTDGCEERPKNDEVTFDKDQVRNMQARLFK